MPTAPAGARGAAIHVDARRRPARYVALWESAPRRRPRRRYRLVTPAVLAGVVAVGAFLRVYGLDRVGFNSDEAVYAGQAASIARVKEFLPTFPIYRAHPLLFQTALSLLYRVHVSDFAGRMFAVIVGLATIIVTFQIGRVLYGRRAGLVSAALLAFMPYHVVVSRQVLLDGTEAFFAALALLCAARYALSHRSAWLYAEAAALGLTFLSKETGIVFAVSFFAFLALSPQVFVRVRDLAGASALGAALLLIYPLSVSLGGASNTGRNFVSWQLLRRANHGVGFYFVSAFPAIGWVVVVLGAVGLIVLRRERSWRETLLLSWILVPLLFFMFWPTKGYQYLLPTAPAFAVLAGRVLGRLPLARPARLTSRVASAFAVSIVLVSLVVASARDIDPSTGGSFLAGTGGVRGGREAGAWLRTNVPEDARLLALGPSMANILEFYGGRKVWGLSVSTNALHRNPVYEPIANPDLALRHNDIQYLVWDAYSANRSPTFAARLLRYVARFHGRVVHSESVVHHRRSRQVIVIYAVRP
jgi:hypothetical protein